MVLQRAVTGTSGSEDAAVPQLAVSVAFLFVLGSVALFIAYISRIANSMRVANIVARIGAHSRVTADARYPRTVSESHPIPPTGPPDRYVACPHPGVIVAINNEALIDIATNTGTVISVLRHVGDHLARGEPLLTVHGSGAHDQQLLRHVAFDTERTYEQDAAFGFRELVDIAERALSPAVNDPTTAAQAIDVLHDLLRRLAARPDPPWCQAGPDGQARLVTKRHHFQDLLAMVVAEINHYGADDIQVPVRLTAMLDDLREVALAEHQDAVMHWRLTVTGR